MDYLIAYDIADPRRLQRTARLLEKRALRCQKSVFLFRGDGAAVEALLDEAAARLDLAVDVIQAWRLGAGQPAIGSARGAVQPVRPAAVVLAARRTLFVAPPPPKESAPSPSSEESTP